MKYRKMKKLLAAHGWSEGHIALWYHPDIDEFYIDGNGGGILVIKKTGGWTDIDNYYGEVNNEEDLVVWMEAYASKI